jgi:hypothetical protein
MGEIEGSYLEGEQGGLDFGIEYKTIWIDYEIIFY